MTEAGVEEEAEEKRKWTSFLARNVLERNY